MEKQQYSFQFSVFDSIDELPDDDAQLLSIAKQATANAYAPYSNFHVAAAARLANGIIMQGTNQENASYPAGLCAERVLLSAVTSQHPNIAIDAMAISYYSDASNNDRPITPCGICRQTINEYQQRQQKPIRLILGGKNGIIYVIENAAVLLPLSFSSNDLKN